MPVATPAKPAPKVGSGYASGDIIASKYRLKSQIGEGGMGTVWLARNTTLHVDVAIKLVRREIAGSDEAAQRLLNEARAAAQIEHPSIVRVHDFGETDRGDPFIVMQLLVGESLEQVLERDGWLDATKIVQLLLPILSALSKAHAKGIVHRDLKPDNIILVPDDAGGIVPKLVDFGIAKLRYRTIEVDHCSAVSVSDAAKRTARRLTKTGQVIGCPLYMSPEQARGDTNVDERADLWALSVILYESIKGVLPFDHDDTEQLLIAILADTPDPIDDLDPALWKIVERGLAKKRDDRWPNARELAEALAGWLVANGVENDLVGRSLRQQWLTDRTTLARGTPAGLSVAESWHDVDRPHAPDELRPLDVSAVETAIPQPQARSRSWAKMLAAVGVGALLTLAGVAYNQRVDDSSASQADASIASASAPALTVAAPSVETVEPPASAAVSAAPVTASRPVARHRPYRPRKPAPRKVETPPPAPVAKPAPTPAATTPGLKPPSF